MLPPASDFAEILRVLHAQKVRFIVVGGVGAVLQGAPIATFDLDIVHARSRANCIRLTKALHSLGAHYRGHAKPLHPTETLLMSAGHHLLATKHGPLDVLGSIGKGHDYRQLSKSSQALVLEPGLRIRILRLATLIKIKSETARGKDRAILPILRQTLDEQERKRRQQR